MKEFDPRTRFTVWIIERETGELVKELGPMSYGKAVKVERALQLSMDTENYYSTLHPFEEYDERIN